MTTVGIDLGETTSHATIWENEKADTFEFPMNAEGYATLRAKVPLDTPIVSESSGTAYPFHRQRRELGYHDLTVAHPKELVWIVRSKKKNDKVDSVKLAKLHAVGMILEAHLLEPEEQTFRDLLPQRCTAGRGDLPCQERDQQLPQARGGLVRPAGDGGPVTCRDMFESEGGSCW